MPVISESPTASSQTDMPAAGLSRLRLVLLFAFIGTLLDGAELNLIGYPLTFIAATLHVSTYQMVQVVTYQGFASIVGGLVIGWLGDTLGRRKTFTLSVLAFALAAVLGGLAPNYLLFLITRLLAGFGMGGLFGLSFAMFTEAWTTSKRGTMGGLIQSMYFLGQILTVAILFLCLHMLGNALGWRTGYVIVGVVSLLVGIAAFAVLPESTAWLTYQRQFANGTIQIEKRRSKIPLIDIFRSQYATGTILFMLLSTAMFLTTNSVGVYVSTFLIKIQHMALGTASLIVLLGYGCTMIAYTVTGIASDYIRRKWAFVGACLFGTAGFTFFLILVLTKNDHVSSNFWASPTFWALMWCAAASGGFGVLGVWMSEFFPTRIRSTGSNASYYAGRGLGAGVFPLFALTLAGGSIAGALSLGIAGPVAGTILAALAKDRTSGRVIAAIE